MDAHAQLQAWLIQNFGAEKFRPGLDRVGGFVAVELARVKKLAPHIMTVAGTNGKGETAMRYAQLCRRQGERFVLWTSPHLLRVTERFGSESGEISVQELKSLVEGVRDDAHRSGVGLSYYEVLFCAFLRWGLERGAPHWIMEVGMGGRLDAVNLLDADIVALTSISRDHQEFLGNTYAAILREKLGVCRPGKRLVSALEPRYLRELTARFCQDNAVPWTDLFETGVLTRAATFSERNQALAKALREWPSGSQNDDTAPVLPGRGEKWRLDSTEFTFYGPHNPDGMRKLVQLLGSGFYTNPQENFHQVWAAFSRRSMQDLAAMARMLAELASPRRQVYLTQFEHPKAMPLGEWWREEGFPINVIHEWSELIKRLPKHETKVLVIGSYYFVGVVQSRLLELGGAPSSRC